MERGDILQLALLWAAAGIALLIGRRYDRQQKQKMRERLLDADYPQIVGDLSLFVGAGVHVINALQRMAEGYRQRLAKGAPRRPGYDQIVRLCRQLQDGAGEEESFAALGARCRTRHYIKLSMILSAGVRQGERQTAALLEKEETLALELRRRQARKRGEEASTKLLVPLTMLLAVLMAVLMVPAFWGITLW